MASFKYIRENSEASCRVLIDRINNADNDSKRLFYLRDFVYQLLNLRASARNYYLSKVLIGLLEEDFKKLFGDIAMDELSPRPKADIAIITVRQPELIAAKVALGIDPKRLEDREEKGFRIWHTRQPCDRSEEPLNVILTMSGIARNVHCSNACHVVFNEYDVRSCMLIGIGAGDPGKHSIGDVAAAKTIIDTEGGRYEPNHKGVRPETSNVPLDYARYLEAFDPDMVDWYDLLTTSLSELSQIKPIPKSLPEAWKPTYSVEPFFVTEKLRVDKPWKEMQDQYHQEGRVLEMEAHGFAKACETYGIPWLVFRGISDFADLESKERFGEDIANKDVWQPYAALSAATAAVSFIKNSLKIKEKSKF